MKHLLIIGPQGSGKTKLATALFKTGKFKMLYDGMNGILELKKKATAKGNNPSIFVSNLQPFYFTTSRRFVVIDYWKDARYSVEKVLDLWTKNQTK